MKSKFRASRGFTLIEILIALAIAGVIVGEFSAIFVRLAQTGSFDVNQANVARNLDTAGAWFIKDFQEASASHLPSSVTLTPTANGTPSLTITQYLTASPTTVTYTIDSNGNLLRNGTVIGVNISQVQYITGSNSITVTSTAGTLSETRTYQIDSRVA
jgi:prepilin-type N-terminal cleavage/methylation domain-containing protein